MRSIKNKMSYLRRFCRKKPLGRGLGPSQEPGVKKERESRGDDNSGVKGSNQKAIRLPRRLPRRVLRRVLRRSYCVGE